MVKKSHMKTGALAAAVTVAMVMGGVAVKAQAQSGAMGSSSETWGTGASGAAGTGSGTPVIPQTPATSGAPGGTGTYGTGTDGTGMGTGMPHGAGMSNGAGTDGTGMMPGMSNGMGTYGTGAPEAMGMQDRSGAWGERSTRRSRATVTPAITNDSIYPEQWPWEMHGNTQK